ncbi:Glucokinase [Aequoribacter fuscus]|uniref:Glucokinase n=1 Tax=Aequoribacter fuscus TaxID=2518989 RepID=F3KZ06_9GAMM|nr:glucokinase [Aequoribacter fuscus]EGG30684.1 Glucokinase [Aequoribacter fuscus]
MMKDWNLVADIGGTNARFGVFCRRTQQLEITHSYAVADYPKFEDALAQFLNEIDSLKQHEKLPRFACLAVACVPDNEIIQFTNSSWRFQKSDISHQLGGAALVVINDFAAVAYAIPSLKSSDYIEIGGHSATVDKPIIVLGPGTGLGVASLIPNPDSGYSVVGGEGGHADFAPVTPLEISILTELQKRYERVSIERLLSGAGIINIYEAIANIKGREAKFDSAAAIAQAANDGSDSLASSAMNAFFAILGSTAGNLALTLGAMGGVYIAGGITPRYPELLRNSEFRARFEAKGRFKSYLQPIVLRVITKDHLGLLGAAERLNILENS